MKALVCLVAARQAGARGASEEQYRAFLDEMFSRLYNAPRPRRLQTAELEKLAVLSAVTAFQLKGGMAPLCPQVQWSIKAIDHIEEIWLNWLKVQPNNVKVERQTP